MLPSLKRAPCQRGTVTAGKVLLLDMCSPSDTFKTNRGDSVTCHFCVFSYNCIGGNLSGPVGFA